jgi:hypothetical protein
MNISKDDDWEKYVFPTPEWKRYYQELRLKYHPKPVVYNNKKPKFNRQWKRF